MLIYKTLGFLLLVQIARAELHREEQPSEVLRLSFSKHKQASKYAEWIGAEKGIAALRQTSDDASNRLTLLELTNGSIIVQLIFVSTDNLTDCDISNSPQQIHKLLQRITSKHEHPSFKTVEEPYGGPTSNFSNTKTERQEKDYLVNIEKWVNECNSLQNQRLELESGKTVRASRVRAKVEQVEGASTSAGKRRDKRGIMDLIYPGKLYY